jgi:hypothetical protein
MEPALAERFDEQISIEHYCCLLYRLFSGYFPEHSDFWLTMSREEELHAAIIQSGRDILYDQGLFGADIISDNLKEMRALRLELETVLEEWSTHPPSRRTAYMFAAGLEEDQVIAVFDQKMSEPTDSPILKIIQKMNDNATGHARRIRELIAATRM